MNRLHMNQAMFERARKVIPVCAQTFSKSHLQHVQGVSPIFLERGAGSHVWDVDGNEYIDYIQGLLPNILGYANDTVNDAVYRQLKMGHSFSLPHPVEVELAEKLCEIIPCAQMVRFGKNGSDATAAAVRVARAHTGRDIIACCGYHGWQDWFIGSTTRSLGVPDAIRKLTCPFVYNDISSLNNIFDQHKGNVAAVIMEPVNFIEPLPGFLEEVKTVAHANGALLIFDEICSGWHLGLGGAQKFYNITPDLACFGKAMGNGFPISAVVGRGDVMRIFEDIFVSFTFAGEVASMAAALSVIKILETEPVIDTLCRNGAILKSTINSLAADSDIGSYVKCLGFPQWSLVKFLNGSGKDWLELKSLFQQEIAKRGILSIGTHNLCYAISATDVETTVSTYNVVIPLLADAIKTNTVESRLEGTKIQAIFSVR